MKASAMRLSTRTPPASTLNWPLSCGKRTRGNDLPFAPGQGFSSSFFFCQDGLVRAPAFGLQELVTVFRDLLLVIDEAIHDASAARLDAGTEPSRILPTGLHALLVRQAHFQRVVTRIGDVVLVIEQTINY